ncbi:MAG: class I SAM-dependent methyltransferase [Nitrospirota bacterium]
MITLYEPLGLGEGHKLLEIGLGTGYSAVVAREIVGEEGLVVCVEIDPDVFEEGKRFVQSSGYDDIVLILGDGASGYPEKAPYDRICVTAACTEVPPALFEQLKPGGKLIAPVVEGGIQSIVLFEKNDKGIERKLFRDGVLNIPYVPMIGEYGTKLK